MNRNEFATTLKTKLEELNLIRSNEKFFVECVDDKEVAKISVVGDNEKEMSVVLTLENLQESVDKHGWDEVINTTGKVLKKARNNATGYMDALDMLDEYENIKSKLIIRPIHWDKEFDDKNKKKPCLYSKKGDIALVLYMIMSDGDGTLETIRVPMDCVQSWMTQLGLKEIDIFKNAMQNTVEKQSPMLYTNIFDMSSEKGMNVLNNPETSFSEGTSPLVTTNRKTNGAIAMFYPGVKEKIAKMMNDSFYVAFTSVHEAIVHKKGTIDPAAIKRNVTETNRIFGPNDALTNEVFYFNKETNEFSVLKC